MEKINRSSAELSLRFFISQKNSEREMGVLEIFGSKSTPARQKELTATKSSSPTFLRQSTDDAHRFQADAHDLADEADDVFFVVEDGWGRSGCRCVCRS